MPGRAIKIDKRLPLFIGGRAGIIESDRLQATLQRRAEPAEAIAIKIND